MNNKNLYLLLILIGLFLLTTLALMAFTPAGAEIVAKMVWSG